MKTSEDNPTTADIYEHRPDNVESRLVTALINSRIDMGESAESLRRAFKYSPLSNASDEALRRATVVVSRIAGALLHDQPEAWQAISAAWETLEGLQTEGAKRSRVVELVEWYAVHRVRHGVELFEPIFRALQIYHQRFKKLERGFAKKAFDKAKPADGEKRVGRGNVGALRVAAELSCSVKAFGDRKVEASKRAFGDAVKEHSRETVE